MIGINKKPLPLHCIPTQPNGQPKTMLTIEGVVVRSFSAVRERPDIPYDLQTCWNLLYDLNVAGPQRGKVMKPGFHQRYYTSPHYLIGRNGIIWETIPPPIRAFHAGKSNYQGRDYCTNWMIGVSLICTPDDEVTEFQYSSLASLCLEFMRAYGFKRDMIAPYHQVAIPSGVTDEPRGFNLMQLWNEMVNDPMDHPNVDQGITLPSDCTVVRIVSSFESKPHQIERSNRGSSSGSEGRAIER